MTNQITFWEYLEKANTDLPKNLSYQKAISWVDNCINSFSRNHSANRLFCILAKLLKTFGHLQEFKNSISNKIPKIISKCISTYSNNDVESSLDCLEILLLTFGNACFTNKANISEYLERFLCSTLNINVITKAGNALHLLQQVGNSGKNGSIHKKQWLDYVHILCRNMNVLYDIFFEYVQEFEITESGENVKPFSCILQDTPDKIQIVYRLRNDIIFFKCALLKQFSCEKTIPFYTVLQVLKRGLSIDEYSDDTQEEDFLNHLYIVQINLLHLLKVLLISGAPGIRKQFEDILKLLLNCLKRTNKQFFANRSEYCRVLYDALNEYISLEKENLSSSVCETILSHGLKYILETIKPCIESSQIEELPHANMFIDMVYTNKRLGSTCIRCRAIIHTITNLLHNTVTVNEHKLHVLYMFATDQIFNFQIGNAINLYPEYTKDLYKLLNVICTIPNYCSLPVLNCTVSILSSNLGNRTQLNCMQGLDAIKNLVNPVYPSLTIVKTNSGIDNNLITSNEKFIRNTNVISNLNLQDTCTKSNATHVIEVENVDTLPNDIPPTKLRKLEKFNSGPAIITDYAIVHSQPIKLHSINANGKQASTQNIQEATKSPGEKSEDQSVIIESDIEITVELSDSSDEQEMCTEIIDCAQSIYVPKTNENAPIASNPAIVEEALDDSDEENLLGMFKDIPKEEFLNI